MLWNTITGRVSALPCGSKHRSRPLGFCASCQVGEQGDEPTNTVAPEGPYNTHTTHEQVNNEPKQKTQTSRKHTKFEPDMVRFAPPVRGQLTTLKMLLRGSGWQPPRLAMAGGEYQRRYTHANNVRERRTNNNHNKTDH